MKLRYKYQPFQAEACRRVVEVFKGQPKSEGLADHIVDPGNRRGIFATAGYGNKEIVLSRETLAENVRAQQMEQGLKPIEYLEGEGVTLTIEMETGTGKTYTYIKTMYELNAKYGWCKFVVVVPSIAIREGVYKSFESTEEHFMQEYGKRMQYFIYNSKQLNQIDVFAQDPGLHVMIINTQAFNSSLNEEKNREGRAGDSSARIIFSSRDEFGSRKPIDIIAHTRPILIIDEPQSVLGTNRDNATRKGIALFNPLLTLLYSATHRKGDIYNMVYRLDAIDAYNKKLVKKIEVKGIKQIGSTATNGYVYLDEIVLSQGNPQARISFDAKSNTSIKQVTKLVNEGVDLKAQSGGLAEYEDDFVVEQIDGWSRTILFKNGLKLQEGDAVGQVNEDLFRRIQIRETIRTHIERERQLFKKHIKVLSLFFIDHVDNYRIYEGDEKLGKFAKMFEEEYYNVLQSQMMTLTDSEYMQYLSNPANSVEHVHQGYFAKDKGGHLKDSKEGRESAEDESVFDLIMKDKERLLSFEEPVRFIFSHSALKEGWDNPNVFQICTLKNSDNTTKKRQEIGRGMRLCVNDRGERQDVDVLGEGVFDTNILTVIASESYESFSRALQTEMAEACADRPVVVTAALFAGALVTHKDGTTYKIKEDQAIEAHECLIECGYVRKGQLTQKYFEDKKNGPLDFGSEIKDEIKEAIIGRRETGYNPSALRIEEGRKIKEAFFNQKNFGKKEFQELWKRINARTYYTVRFKSEDLITKAIDQLNMLNVTEIRIIVEEGGMESIRSKEDLETGNAMEQQQVRNIAVKEAIGESVKYDLVGELVTNTGLTRKSIIDILQGIRPDVFDQFKRNPEDFILKASKIINGCKAHSVVECIKYEKLGSIFDTAIFTEATIRGKVGVNAIESTKSLYDLVVVDSLGIEKEFAQSLERESEVVVYTKLPRDFYINTPMGHYNPDWAIAFEEGSVKYVYFIAETKGNSLEHLQLRGVEEDKIECARRHFASICTDRLKYDVVSSYQELYNIIKKE